MPEIWTDFSPQMLIRALESSYVDYGRVFAGAPGGELYDEPEMMRFSSGIPVPLRNGVYRAHLAPDTADAKIEETIAYFKARDLPFMWLVGPSSQPQDLGERLAAHGIMHALDAPGMALDLRALVEDVTAPAEFEIRAMRDLKALQDFARVFNESFGMPASVHDLFSRAYAKLSLDGDRSFRNYVGYLAGEPVATTTLLLGEGAAGIFGVSTLPQARRKGIGAKITLHALQDARREGYRVAVLHSSSIAVNVYKALGFREYCKFGIYIYAENAGTLT